MLKWLKVAGVVVFILMFIFFVGTKPAPETDMTNAKLKCNTDQAEITHTAILETSHGNITAELYGKETPKTAENFVKLAKENFYKNLKFHRIIKDFMVQTGDPKGDGTGGPGYTFADELDNNRCYTRGTLAMANSGPNTNGSQFFIVHKDTDLPKLYTIYGGINASDSASLEVLDKIAESPVATNSAGEKSQPVTEILLKSVKIK